MQYAPAAVMLGMKVAGVQSRSSWGRMLVSDAFSALLMGGVVNTLKQTTNVERPDGSNKHSFPSGHTATAFMTATMFTKEYGHKSPWVGVGAYSVATATGLMRMANNKHWLSDVLTGAGIGTLSFYVMSSLRYGALGHAVTDADTGERLLVKSEEIIRASIIGVALGEQGAPGEIRGTFNVLSKRPWQYREQYRIWRVWHIV